MMLQCTANQNLSLISTAVLSSKLMPSHALMDAECSHSTHSSIHKAARQHVNHQQWMNHGGLLPRRMMSHDDDASLTALTNAPPPPQRPAHYIPDLIAAAWHDGHHHHRYRRVQAGPPAGLLAATTTCQGCTWLPSSGAGGAASCSAGCRAAVRTEQQDKHTSPLDLSISLQLHASAAV